MKKIRKILQAAFLTAVLALSGCVSVSTPSPSGKSIHEVPVRNTEAVTSAEKQVSLSDIPAYSGEAYTVINNNVPYFKDSDLTTESYEFYSDLDNLGRCGPAMASIGKDLMPTEKRGSIGMIRPTGWHTVTYDGIEGKHLYNRCHLIGYQLTGENANEKNLITGTRYMNTEGMEPFENMTADYIKETGHHVLYRVTPIFKDNNMVASGVLMEAESVEDQGKDLEFCVYCYNVQPGITIDYSTGDSRKADSRSAGKSDPVSSAPYIGNRNTMVFHYAWCSSVTDMKDTSKVPFSDRQQAVSAGYTPCHKCNP